jgi:hypothetical protein
MVSEISNDQTTSTTTERDSLVDELFDTTLDWVDLGLDVARATLSNAARTLIRTAKSIETVRDRLRT